MFILEFLYANTNILIFLLTALAITFLVVRSSRHSKRIDEIKRRFLEEEEAANLVRKKEIDPELFYTADLSTLPALPENDTAQVERASKRLMIYFKEPITNLELKKQYGVMQMDIIAQYEENFNEYLKALTKWAGSIMADSPDDAIKILELVVSLGGEFRDTYRHSADIYAARGDEAALDALLRAAGENHFNDPNIRILVCEYIFKKKEEIQT